MTFSPRRARLALLRFITLLAAIALPCSSPPAAGPDAALDDLGPPSVIHLEGETRHVQGIEIDGDRLWVTSVDSKAGKGFLMELRLPPEALAAPHPPGAGDSAPRTPEPAAPMIRSVEVQEGDRIHPGGLQGDADTLWLPVAPYRRGGPSRIEQRSKATLEVLFSFETPDHIGCLAVDGKIIAGGNWDSRTIYFWNREGEPLRELKNPGPTAWQDMKFHGGILAGSGVVKGEKDGPPAAIDWFDPDSGTILGRLPMGLTSRGVNFGREGMTLAPGRLLLLPEDGPSRLFVFRAPPVPGAEFTPSAPAPPPPAGETPGLPPGAPPAP